MLNVPIKKTTIRLERNRLYFRENRASNCLPNYFYKYLLFRYFSQDYVNFMLIMTSNL